jgi:hypothetical protein
MRKRADFQVPTLDEIKQWPATVDVPKGGTAFGISRAYSYELVKRNEFPAKLIEAGGVKRVITADILAKLGGAL